MKRVLIATDGSAAADEAVELGVELARDEGAEVIFVHVVPYSDIVSMNGFGLMGHVPYEPTLEEAVLPRCTLAPWRKMTCFNMRSTTSLQEE